MSEIGQRPVLDRVRWDYLVPISSLHVLALLVFVPWLFSWTGLIAFVLGINFFGQLGVPIGYHRLLTHRSFQVPTWLERSFVVLALCCGQNTPARWVTWHRMHHQHSDDHDDPHSPLVAFFGRTSAGCFSRREALTATLPTTNTRVTSSTIVSTCIWRNIPRHRSRSTSPTPYCISWSAWEQAGPPRASGPPACNSD